MMSVEQPSSEAVLQGDLAKTCKYQMTFKYPSKSVFGLRVAAEKIKDEHPFQGPR